MNILINTSTFTTLQHPCINLVFQDVRCVFDPCFQDVFFLEHAAYTYNSCNLAWNFFTVLNTFSDHWSSCIWDAPNLLTGNFAGVGARHCIVWNKNPFQMAPRELSLLVVKSCHRRALITGVVSSCTESLPLQLALFLLMSLLCQKKKKKLSWK